MAFLTLKVVIFAEDVVYDSFIKYFHDQIFSKIQVVVLVKMDLNNDFAYEHFNIFMNFLE
jgi:hypothetical protein